MYIQGMCNLLAFHQMYIIPSIDEKAPQALPEPPAVVLFQHL